MSLDGLGDNRDGTQRRRPGRAGRAVRGAPCCRYIEQVAVALRGRECAMETIQALLRSCRAKTVSSAAAMHQVAGHASGSKGPLHAGFCYPQPSIDSSAALSCERRAREVKHAAIGLGGTHCSPELATVHAGTAQRRKPAMCKSKGEASHLTASHNSAGFRAVGSVAEAVADTAKQPRGTKCMDCSAESCLSGGDMGCRWRHCSQGTPS